MTKLPSVTIVIPAYNEADNLRHLIPDLLQQNQSQYTLENILVMSDNSHDQTGQLKLRLKSEPVTFVMGREQVGKPGRVNQAFSRLNSDIVVVIDADTKILSRGTIDVLVRPIKPNAFMMTSGIAKPLKPENWVEKIAYAGVEVWNRARKYVPTDSLYNCDGMLRAFSRQIYQNMRFPTLASSEDTFPYLYCRMMGWQFRSVQQAKAWYRLPSSFHDYLSQQRRYHTAPDVEGLYFPPELLRKERCLTWLHKIRALAKYFLHDPIPTFGYLIFSVYMRIDIQRHQEEYSAKWEILTSTKKVYA